MLLSSLGVLHSVLGELLIFRHMESLRGFPSILGGDDFPKRMLRAAWHSLSIVGWAFAMILIDFAFLARLAYHRLKSQAAGDRLDRRQEGLFILVTLRPTGILCMLGLVAYITDPAWMAWSSMALPRGLRWAGVGLGIVAGSLLTWTLRSLGRNLTDTVVTRREHTLVTRGPYRLVRHPFYSSVALAIAASALTAANWFVLASGAAALALLAIRMRKEEELLIVRFGDAYRTYMERTGRFVPRVLGRGLG